MSTSPEIDQKIQELADAVARYSHPHAISFCLYINAGEVRTTVEMRSPEKLKKAGISMRNLAGNFITPETKP